MGTKELPRTVSHTPPQSQLTFFAPPVPLLDQTQVRLDREMRFFFFMVFFPAGKWGGNWWCRTPPVLGCTGLLWLAECCTSLYFWVCSFSETGRMLMLTPKSARACCFFSRAESKVPRFYFPGKPVRIGCSPAHTEVEGISLHLWKSHFITLLFVSFLVF